MQRLAGQVAWISGATSGIGEAAARLFAQEGACVALVGRRKHLCEAIAEEIRAAGGRALALACDVSREGEIRASIEQTAEAFGGLHIECRAADITFGVESHVGSLVPTPKSAARLVQCVPGLTLTLDYTHYARKGMPDAEVEPLVQYATHFHVRGACKGRLQTSFDKNTIDYRRIARVMREVGYAGWIGIEYIWIDWEHGNENDCLSETIRFRDFFRSLATHRA